MGGTEKRPLLLVAAWVVGALLAVAIGLLAFRLALHVGNPVETPLLESITETRGSSVADSDPARRGLRARASAQAERAPHR